MEVSHLLDENKINDRIKKQNKRIEDILSGSEEQLASTIEAATQAAEIGELIIKASIQ